MRILIAEGDGAQELAAALQRSRCAAECVQTGQEALERLEKGGYDAAILNAMAPGLEGAAIVRRLRAEGNRVPVLLLGDRASVEDTVLGLDSGANDYLRKPFDMRELLARLRAMLRVSGVHEKLAFGNAVLDLGACTLSTPDGCLRLTRKEFQLMEIFMAQPRAVISAERLLEKIWGHDAAEIGTVWAHISYLRKKLSVLNADIRISSSRNAGYYLEEK